MKQTTEPETMENKTQTVEEIEFYEKCEDLDYLSIVERFDCPWCGMEVRCKHEDKEKIWKWINENYTPNSQIQQSVRSI